MSDTALLPPIYECEICGERTCQPHRSHVCESGNRRQHLPDGPCVIRHLHDNDTSDPDAEVMVTSDRIDTAYHRRDCVEVRDDMVRVTRREAQILGRFPCSRCHDVPTRATVIGENPDLPFVVSEHSATKISRELSNG